MIHFHSPEEGMASGSINLAASFVSELPLVAFLIVSHCDLHPKLDSIFTLVRREKLRYLAYGNPPYAPYIYIAPHLSLLRPHLASSATLLTLSTWALRTASCVTVMYKPRDKGSLEGVVTCRENEN